MTTFKTGDRVLADDAPRAFGSWTPRPLLAGLSGTVIDGIDSDGDCRVQFDNGPIGYIGARHLSLIETPTAKLAEPAIPEITDEQRAAVEWLRRTMNIQLEPHAGLLFDLLPSELTDPQVVLPTEPGWYVTTNKTVVTLDVDGEWTWSGGDVIGNPKPLMPLLRLAVEREPITREQIGNVLAEYLSDEPADANLVSDLYALVNGADQ